MFSLIIATDNAAFDGAEASETARILRAVAARLESGDLDGKARDANGNTVGAWRLNDAEGMAEHLDAPAPLTDTPDNIGAGCANSYLADLLDDASIYATNGRALNALHVAALDEAASRIRERATEDEPGDHYGPKA